jgi:hypothetical protein
MFHDHVGLFTSWRFIVSGSYSALRVRPTASAPAWWSAARERTDVPDAVGMLMAGRTRVELSDDAAAEALEWAASVDGWGAADPKPLFVHSPGAITT